MLKNEDFKIARKHHIVHIKNILDHFENVTNLSPQTHKIKFTGKADIENSLLEFPDDLKEVKGVYGFFVDENKVELLKKALDDHRETKRPKDGKFKDAMPKPNPNNKAKDGCLYIGMVKDKYLHSRIMNHLYHPKENISRTSALKLNKWATKIINEITVCYIIFPKVEEHKLISDYEKALWKYYEPAIGLL